MYCAVLIEEESLIRIKTGSLSELTSMWGIRNATVHLEVDQDGGIGIYAGQGFRYRWYGLVDWTYDSGGWGRVRASIGTILKTARYSLKLEGLVNRRSHLDFYNNPGCPLSLVLSVCPSSFTPTTICDTSGYNHGHHDMSWRVLLAHFRTCVHKRMVR